jgi:inorganic pyrophosphatase
VDRVDPAGTDRPPLRRRVTVRIETPRGNFVKRDWVGGRLRAAFISPVPCPFDYGTIGGEPAEDGLGRDAVWLGPRKKALETAEGVVAAVVRFHDDGAVDDKWVVTATGEISPRDTKRLARFFRFYAAVKRLRGAAARFEGIRPAGAAETPPR